MLPKAKSGPRVNIWGKTRKGISLLLSFGFACQLGIAQIDTLKLTSDELFALAREKAFAGQREDARRLCKMILARSPSYSDVRILLGRTYAWDGRRDEARAEFYKVLSDNPAYKDALNALMDVELWDDKYGKALEIANRGLRSHPNDEDFLLKKARALKNLGRDEEALNVLAQLEDINPSYAGISPLREDIKITSMVHSVAVGYATDRFSEIYDPMHYAYLQLSRRTGYGSVFGRLNYSNRFQTEGIQFESDLYPRIADGVYAYLNYGYSNSNLFPRHRAGAEVYGKLPFSFEGSIGLRHLYFGPSSMVTIYTGSLGLYYGSYWFSLRPYLTPKDGGASKSMSLTVRRYFADAENYVSVRAGAGFSADERSIQSSAGFGGKEVFYLKSQTVSLGWQQSLAVHYLLNITFDLTNQELSFSPGSYVTMYSLSLGFRARF